MLTHWCGWLESNIVRARRICACTAKCNKEETGRAEKKALPVLIRRNVHALVRGSKVTVGSVTKVTGSFVTDLFSATLHERAEQSLHDKEQRKLEEDLETVQHICGIAKRYVPEYDVAVAAMFTRQ